MSPPSTCNRIVINGIAGAGKSTLARELSRRWAIPFIETDALFWQQNWRECPPELFRARVEEATRGESWIFDGNYSSTHDIVWPRAQLLIWLDFPLHLTLRRVLWRSVRRSMGIEKLSHPNVETWRRTFSRDSVVLHSLSAHAVRRRQMPLWIARHPHLQVLRARTPRELRRALQVLERNTGALPLR